MNYTSNESNYRDKSNGVYIDVILELTLFRNMYITECFKRNTGRSEFRENYRKLSSINKQRFKGHLSEAFTLLPF